MASGLSFMGYERARGRPGVRNYVLIVPTVSCSLGLSEAALRRAVADVGEGAVKLLRNLHGCGQAGEDLERQVSYLASYAAAKGYRVVEVLRDVASGLNARRKGLLRLFKLVEGRDVDVVLITYKDRLTRFGFEYIEEFFSSMGVRIEAVFGEEPKGAAQELVEDLISIVTSFAGRIYGMRSHRKTLLVQGVKKLMGELNAEDGEAKG